VKALKTYATVSSIFLILVEVYTRISDHYDLYEWFDLGDGIITFRYYYIVPIRIVLISIYISAIALSLYFLLKKSIPNKKRKLLWGALPILTTLLIILIFYYIIPF